MKKFLFPLVLLFVLNNMLTSQNVGINVPTPLGKFHIKGNSTTTTPQLRLTEEGSDFARIKMESDANANSYWDIAGKADVNTGFSILNFYFSNPTNSGDRMSITGLGDVGIGTTNPLAKLDIASEGDGNELLRFSTERPWVFKQKDSGLNSKLALQSTVNGKDFEILSLDGTTKAATFRLWDNNPTVFLVPDIGKVGIGNNSPQHTLHVSGSFEVDSLISFDEVKFNTAIGSNSLVSTTTGHDNTAIGFQSLTSNESGIRNTAVGAKSMLNNVGGSDNTAVGDLSLSENTIGTGNCAYGHLTMHYNKEGSYNTAIGRFALLGSGSPSDVGGNSNTVIGSSAARETDGSNNVIIGRNAFSNNNYGGNNTIIGTNAGLGSTFPNTGYSNSVLIGYEAGKTETEGDRLYIENSSSSTPLIYGEFDNDYLLINGTQEITEVLNFPHTGTALQIEGIDVLGFNYSPTGIQFVWGEGNNLTNYNSFTNNIVISPDLTTPQLGNIRVTDFGASITLETTDDSADSYIALKGDGPGLQWRLRRDGDESGYFEIGHNTSEIFTITPSGNVGIGNNILNISSTLYVDGDVTATNIPMGDYANMQYNTSNGKFYYDNSSARYKENIINLDVDFKSILAARPVQYTRPRTPERIEIGYIAEEMDALGLSHLIDYGKEGLVENFNYEKMILYVVEVLKDQNKTIENQLDINEQLQKKIDNQQVQIDQILALLKDQTKD